MQQPIHTPSERHHDSDSGACGVARGSNRRSRLAPQSKEGTMRIHADGHRKVRELLLVLILSAVALACFTVRAAPAGALVPSVGLTKPVNGDVDAKMSTGLAFRADVTPGLMGEIGVAYRSESRFDNQLDIRSWPVTASLYFKPGPLYVGAGVGWYQTTFAFADGSPFEDETRQDFGVHAGGGLELPITKAVGVDLNGRYVMMQDQQSQLVPESFDPDFWAMSLGLAMHF
jgi:hypothetical protein